ncbi:BAG family molecular chaperone regulator 7 isoform X2 [Corylus avellana]|uniref:BAG family molecular chaperone regulator 7 isoform X2 n=1 Tax=Corylus avellana TaxID=13451 RepID=UPI001E1F701B|nr:BAG family molecular chaperone regulator 7 isoform X2 [Corylus avellana]
MSLLRRIDLIEPHYYPSLFVRETSIFAPEPLAFPSFVEEEFDLCFGLDLLNRKPSPSAFFDAVTDLVRINETPSFSSYRRIQRVEKRRGAESFYLQSLCDRVSELESRFDRLVNAKEKGGDRKYTWTAEIKSLEKDGVERKYKWTAEIKDGKKMVGGAEKNCKWTAEIKGKGETGRPVARTYTFKASSGDAVDCSGSKKKNKKKGENDTRVVEIEHHEDHEDHGAVILRQAFAKRVGAVGKSKGKRKELSPQDAALMIQISFRAYLIRRSQTLRALRDLAVAKTKLKEIRSFFHNFSYRRRVAHDAEERQRFTEKIIVLLLTVDAIEGTDLMVRAAKRSMVDELEAMLDVVDPQPTGKSLSMRRRTFDMPDAVIQKEIAAGVRQVVQMLNEEEESANTDFPSGIVI